METTHNSSSNNDHNDIDHGQESLHRRGEEAAFVEVEPEHTGESVCNC